MSAAKKTTDVRNNAFPNVTDTYEVSFSGLSAIKVGDANYLFLELNTKNKEGVEQILSMIVAKYPNYTEEEKTETFIIKTTEVEDKKYPKIEIEELA